MRAQKSKRPQPEAGAAATPSRDGGDDNEVRSASMHKRAQQHKKARNGGDAAAYNDKHAAEVAAFNQRTENRCVGEDGKLDIAAVEAWQAEHGVEPDGKIGKQTLAAAGAPAEVARD